MTQQTPSPDDRDGSDVLARLAAYSPTTATLAAEWNPADRADLRARLLQDAGTPPASRFRARRTHGPHRTRRAHVMAPLAAAAAVIALIVGIVSLAVRHDGGARPGLPPGGAPYTAPSTRDTERVGPGQYSYRRGAAFTVSASGHRRLTDSSERWIAPNGDVWDVTTHLGKSECSHFPKSGDDSFGGPTQAFIDRLPTDADELETYLRDHVSGSTSRDEAVFVAVGDLLGAADGLATTTLRAALVEVLSRTGGVTVHPDVRDVENRPAIRADFVDPRNRGTEIESMYFATGTYQLISHRSGTLGKQTRYDGPSPAYTAAPTGTGTPVELTGSATYFVNSDETVVDSLPARLDHCPTYTD